MRPAKPVRGTPAKPSSAGAREGRDSLWLTSADPLPATASPAQALNRQLLVDGISPAPIAPTTALGVHGSAGAPGRITRQAAGAWRGAPGR